MNPTTRRAALTLAAVAATLTGLTAGAAPADATPKNRFYVMANSGVEYRIWTYHVTSSGADHVVVDAYWHNQPIKYHDVGVELRFRDQRKPKTAAPACSFRNYMNPDEQHADFVHHSCLDKHGLIDYVDVTIQDGPVLTTKRVKVTN